MSPASHRLSGIATRLYRYTVVGAEKAIRIPIAVIVAGLISRTLGVEDFGTYSSVLVLVAVFGPLASFGLESLGVPMASRGGEAPAFLRTVGAFRLATGLIAALCFIAAVFHFFRILGSPDLVFAALALSSIFVFRGHEVFEYLLFAKEKLQNIALSRMVACILANLLIIGAILAGAGLPVILALASLEAAILLVVLGLGFRSEVAVALRSANSPVSRSARPLALAVAAMPVFASGALVLLMLNLDRLLVYRFMGAADAGLYNAAAKLVEVLYFIPLVAGSVHVTAMTRATSSAEMSNIYRNVFVDGSVLSIAAGLVLAMSAGLLLPLVFGAPFAGASAAMIWLSPTLVAVTWVSIRTRALAALDMRSEILKLTSLAFIVHVPLLAIGLKLGSIEAVAASQSAGWLVAAILVPLISRPAYAFSPIGILRKRP